MISDTLSDAANEIRGYLAYPGTAAAYGGPLRSRILRLLVEMGEVQRILDTQVAYVEPADPRDVEVAALKAEVARLNAAVERAGDEKLADYLGIDP